MVVIQKMELESFQRCTMKGEGAEVTSCSKRNFNCMSEVKKKKKSQREWSDAGREAQRGCGGPWRYSKLGCTQPWVTCCELDLDQRFPEVPSNLNDYVIQNSSQQPRGTQDLWSTDSPASWVILYLLHCLKTGFCEMFGRFCGPG